MQYKNVTSEDLRDKILSFEYDKLLIKKTGRVTARCLKAGEVVKTYYYDEMAKIQNKEVEITTEDKVLITKKINNKDYQSVITALTFYKTYAKCKNEEYVPLVDYFYGYTLNENIRFTNCFEQIMSMCPGDLIVPQSAKLESFYGIYRHNFEDNYCVVENLEIKSEPDAILTYIQNVKGSLKR